MTYADSSIRGKPFYTLAQCKIEGLIIPKQLCYKKGGKYCSRCQTAFKTENRYCPLCHSILRVKPFCATSRKKYLENVFRY